MIQNISLKHFRNLKTRRRERSTFPMGCHCPVGKCSSWDDHGLVLLVFDIAHRSIRKKETKTKKPSQNFLVLRPALLKLTWQVCLYCPAPQIDWDTDFQDSFCQKHWLPWIDNPIEANKVFGVVPRAPLMRGQLWWGMSPVKGHVVSTRASGYFHVKNTRTHKQPDTFEKTQLKPFLGFDLQVKGGTSI